MHELFRNDWVLRLVVRYFLARIRKDEFLVWCRNTMTKDHEDNSWDMDRAMAMIQNDLDRCSEVLTSHAYCPR